jgi:predicted nuclease with TOPRIM domain
VWKISSGVNKSYGEIKTDLALIKQSHELKHTELTRDIKELSERQSKYNNLQERTRDTERDILEIKRGMQAVHKRLSKSGVKSSYEE